MAHNNPSYNDLVNSIEHWNEYRVPILRISNPDKNLHFQGAMRFYFQDSGQKVATKCVNVTSADTTKDVIDVLIEKFRPDMRMLSVPEYGLYEIHENGDERKLAPEERPILVQLEWNKDDREGRFLLRRMDEKTRNLNTQNEEPSLKRVLSKKEKKKQEKLRKQQQKEQEKADAAANKLAAKNKNGIAERLYNELPETSFTRSISNPEAVMKRRRAQKLEKRLHEFSMEGGQEAGGTLRIFGKHINKDVSYKTLLLSTRDTASFVVKQVLEKYGKDDEDPANYCLVQLIVPASAASGDNNSVHDLNFSSALRESILDDQDCPLLINHNHDESKGVLTFHIRPKPADYQKRRKKKPSKAQVQTNPLHPLVVQQLNQRLQMNNNTNNFNNNNNLEQFRDQNSPQNSSHTSGSLNHDLNNPPPPSFETVHSMPTLYPSRNGTGMVLYPHHQQPHSISTSTLPSRMAGHPNQNNMAKMAVGGGGGTMQRVPGGGFANQPPAPLLPIQPQQQPHQNHLLQNHHLNNNRPFAQNQIVPNNAHHHYPNVSVGAPNHPPQPQAYLSPTGANDQILPALIQVKEDVEDIFLQTVITHIIPNNTPFRLAPTYVLYMVSRYRASTLFHPELQAPRRAELFVPFTKKIASLIRNAIDAHMRDPTYLAFWLANSSDLSHFYKQDKHLSHFTIDAQEILYDSIKASFKYLLSCKQLELDAVLHTFFDERNDEQQVATNGPQATNGNRPGGTATGVPIGRSAIESILDVLTETMATMRKNRVNASLTIQIYSHLFHHISKWLFDRLIGVYDSRPDMLGNQANFSVYCNRYWGDKLSKRLAAIGVWAQKQGLEQTADFHLARVMQVTIFLSRNYPQRISPQDIQNASDACDRLNPIQKRALLKRYQPDHQVISAIIENIIYQMDHRFIAGDYPLEEDFELKIPVLIPEDGYSSELIRYIPNGLLDFVSCLSKMRIGEQELCIFTVQPTSSGHWTVYFKNHQADTPDIIYIQLKKQNNSMGLSIIAARGLGQDRLGIYIKNVVKNGAAALDGRLQAGDQLLEVDGNSLVDITQEQAAELMMRTNPVVTLRIAKQAAIYHNVTDIINSVPTQTIVSPQSVSVPPPPQAYAPHQPPPPPAPVPLEPMPQQVMPSHQHLQSPVKSPKKVSWVDTQPDQSLHTLIPLPHDPEPCEPSQVNSNGTHEEDELLPSYHDVDPSSYNSNIHNQNHNLNHHQMMQEQQQQQRLNHNYNNNQYIGEAHRGQRRDDDVEEDDDEDDDDTSSDEQQDDRPVVNGQTHNHNQFEHPPAKSQNGQMQENSGGDGDGTQNADATIESLTLEDIDEVLSSKTHNNWIEDSAGVIGTQEVYNDPRHRIVKERERTNADVNIEKLSFQEKLKMFNISAKK